MLKICKRHFEKFISGSFTIEKLKYVLISRGPYGHVFNHIAVF